MRRRTWTMCEIEKGDERRLKHAERAGASSPRHTGPARHQTPVLTPAILTDRQ